MLYLIFTISGFIRRGIFISAIGAICTFIGLFRRKFRTIGTAAALASVTAMSAGFACSTNS